MSLLLLFAGAGAAGAPALPQGRTRFRNAQRFRVEADQAGVAVVRQAAGVHAQTFGVSGPSRHGVEE